jgi:hypothetical protein
MNAACQHFDRRNPHILHSAYCMTISSTQLLLWLTIISVSVPTSACKTGSSAVHDNEGKEHSRDSLLGETAWCYNGPKALAKGGPRLTRRKQSRPPLGSKVLVEWRPYQIDPGTKLSGEPG